MSYGKPHFNTFCEHGKLRDFAGCGQFFSLKLEESCYIFITSYFPLHAGSDGGKVVARQAQTCYVDDQIAHQSGCQGEVAYADELETVIGQLIDSG